MAWSPLPPGLKPKRDVFLNVEVGKQCVILKQVANSTISRGHVDAYRRIEKNAAVYRDTSIVWPLQSGNRFKRRALAGTGRSEHDVKVLFAGESHVKMKFAGSGTQGLTDIDFNAHV